MLTGINGVGKRTAAIEFAKACNCSRLNLSGSDFIKDGGGKSDLTACGECHFCRAISAGKHPDFILLEPESKSNIIKIGRIRELSQRLVFQPHEASFRVIIIQDAQTMNRAAANALLKSLEEPPARTLFFLTAEQTSDLLPTIVSRCQHVRFNPLSAASITGLLQTKFGISGDAAGAAAMLAEGSLAMALSLVKKSSTVGLSVRRQWLIEGLNNLQFKSLPLILDFAEKIAVDKNILQYLDIIKGYLRDVLICQHYPEKIYNTDFTGQIKEVAATQTSRSLMLKMEAVLEVEKALVRNCNKRLWMDCLAMKLADI